MTLISELKTHVHINAVSFTLVACEKFWDIVSAQIKIQTVNAVLRL